MGATDVIVLAFEGGGGLDILVPISPNWIVYFHINRVNSEQDTLLVNIMNRSHNIIDTTTDVVFHMISIVIWIYLYMGFVTSLTLKPRFLSIGQIH